jgi:hypothetical protein
MCFFFFFFVFSLSTQIKGNCYVWSLIPGTKLPDGEEGSTPTQLRPKSRLLAHKRYGLKCKFSPDAKYTFASFSLNFFFNLTIDLAGTWPRRQPIKRPSYGRLPIFPFIPHCKLKTSAGCGTLPSLPIHNTQ